MPKLISDPEAGIYGTAAYVPGRRTTLPVRPTGSPLVAGWNCGLRAQNDARQGSNPSCAECPQTKETTRS